MPTPKVEAEANMYSSQGFAKLVKSKDETVIQIIFCGSNQNDFMKDAGIYTDEDIKGYWKTGEKNSKLKKKSFCWQERQNHKGENCY